MVKCTAASNHTPQYKRGQEKIDFKPKDLTDVMVKPTTTDGNRRSKVSSSKNT